jgi:curved DNA-binding protein CbpA
MPRVVRLRQGASSSSLKLSAEESSFLAQVDGSLDEDELALMTGLTPDHVGELVDRLVLIGAIEAQDAEAARRTPPARPIIPTPPPSQPAASARSAAIAGAAGPPSSGPTSVDLDPAKRARIDALWGRIDEISYYEILGVAATADKKQVKSAYYGLAPEFHPDKFFRKQIGDYKHKIEAIFARITLAHDVLTVPARRAEYDAYLEQTRMNKSTAAVLEQPREDVEAILAAVERAAADAARRGRPRRRALRAFVRQERRRSRPRRPRCRSSACRRTRSSASGARRSPASSPGAGRSGALRERAPRWRPGRIPRRLPARRRRCASTSGAPCARPSARR